MKRSKLGRIINKIYAVIMVIASWGFTYEINLKELIENEDANSFDSYIKIY